MLQIMLDHLEEDCPPLPEQKKAGRVTEETTFHHASDTSLSKDENSGAQSRNKLSRNVRSLELLFWHLNIRSCICRTLWLKQSFFYSLVSFCLPEWKKDVILVLQRYQFLPFSDYKTTAAPLSFMIHILATKLDLQAKLRQEIDAVLGDTAEPNYDSISEMEYLGKCVDAPHVSSCRSG